MPKDLKSKDDKGSTKLSLSQVAVNLDLGNKLFNQKLEEVNKAREIIEKKIPLPKAVGKKKKKRGRFDRKDRNGDDTQSVYS